MNISVLRNFSELPGLRHCSISSNSGEKFYHDVLNKKFAETLEKKEKLIVDLDGTAGYASSFLDEAFGNLVYDFSLSLVKANLEIKSLQEPHWIDMIVNKTYLEWEERRMKGEAPTITEKHEPWFRIVNGKMQLKIWQELQVA